MIVQVAAATVQPPSSRSASVQTGELAGLEALFRAHYPAVIRWARALGVAPSSAEDVAQQVFLIAGRRPVPDGSPRAWLFGITRKACANHRRGRDRAKAREAQADPPEDFPRPEAMAERAHAAALLQRFLDGLPEAQRLAFVLYEIDGLDANEAGEALGIAAGTVHARVRLAREKLDRFIARQQRRADR